MGKIKHRKKQSNLNKFYTENHKLRKIEMYNNVMRRFTDSSLQHDDGLDGWLQNALRANNKNDSSRQFPRGKSSQAQKLINKKVNYRKKLPPLPEDICNKVLKNSKIESKTTVDNTRRVHQDAAEILQTVRYGNTTKPQLSRANVNQIKYSPSEKMQTSNPKKIFTNTTKSKTDYVSRCLSTSRFKPKNSKEKLTYNDIPKIKKNVKKIMNRRDSVKFIRDYDLTSDKLMNMNLHRYETWTESKRSKLKTMFSAYLGSTPGSSKALDGMF